MFRQLFISLLVKEVIRLGQPHLNVWVSAMKCFLITIPRWSRWTCFLPTLPSFSVPWWPSIMVDWRGPNKRIHEKNAVFIADDITVIYVTISTQLSSFFFFQEQKQTPANSLRAYCASTVTEMQLSTQKQTPHTDTFHTRGIQINLRCHQQLSLISITFNILYSCVLSH